VSDQKRASRNEQVLEEGTTAWLTEAENRAESGDAPLAPVPSLLMMSGDNTGLCTGDACAVPVPSRKVH
jgi:hypothetical protein